MKQKQTRRRMFLSSSQLRFLHTQSTAPGRVISVAKKTISSPCKVVMDLCASQRCCMTLSRLPCHLQDAPGHGHVYYQTKEDRLLAKQQ